MRKDRAAIPRNEEVEVSVSNTVSERRFVMADTEGGIRSLSLAGWSNPSNATHSVMPSCHVTTGQISRLVSLQEQLTVDSIGDRQDKRRKKHLLRFAFYSL
jgi:hypothetical protein